MKRLPFDDRSWDVRKRAFRIWQRTPHEVAPMTDVERTCQSCGTVYMGNFCPRCGQAARVGRFSFKTAFFLFLDIWGIGNRGMFRTIRDLMLRPGYMIRDYVGGRQSSYFPPFKMFFILATFTFLFTHGISLDVEEPKNEGYKFDIPEDATEQEKKIGSKALKFKESVPDVIMALEKKNPSLFALVMLILASAPLYIFIRKCPAVPDLRYSEHIVALVYTANTYSLYRMIGAVFPLGGGLFKLMAVVMIFVSLKQFTGYSKRRLLTYIILTGLISAVVLVLAVCLAAVIYFTFF